MSNRVRILALNGRMAAPMLEDCLKLRGWIQAVKPIFEGGVKGGYLGACLTLVASGGDRARVISNRHSTSPKSRDAKSGIACQREEERLETDGNSV
jgi:hypothetical protein